MKKLLLVSFLLIFVSFPNLTSAQGFTPAQIQALIQQIAALQAQLNALLQAQGISPASFQAGDRVQTTNDDVNIRNTPAGTARPIQQDINSGGTVIEGPIQAILRGTNYIWWNVNFDTGPDGWVAENFLVKVRIAVDCWDAALGRMVNCKTIPPSTTVDLKVNGSDGPVSIVSGSTVNFSWKSAPNVASCAPIFTKSGTLWTNSIFTSGTQISFPIMESDVFSIKCQVQSPPGVFTTVVDSVTVNVTTGVNNLQIVQPSAGEKLEQGRSYKIGWTGQDYNTSGAKVTSYAVYLVGGGLPVKGGSIYLGTVNLNQSLSFVWTVPTDVTPGSGYQISFSGEQATGDNSDSFTIVSATLPSTTVDLKANGSDGPITIARNSSANITWTSIGTVSGCSLTPYRAGSDAFYSSQVSPSGSQNSGTITESTRYEITCNGNSVRDSVTINVPPNISFYANPANITSGQSSTLSWSSYSASTCTAGGGWSGNKSPRGYIPGPELTETVSPTQTTTYTLFCTGAGGSATQSVTVTVSPAPTTPAPTATLTATQTSGGSYQISWNSTNATSCISSGDGASWGWPSARYISGGQVTPVITTTQTFTITCTGPGGSKSASVTVNPYVTPTPAPTVTLTASPSSITAGQSSTLSWTSTNASSCYTQTPEQDSIIYGGTSGSRIVTPPQSYQYLVGCYGSSGQVAYGNVTVTVNPVVAPTPAPTLTLYANPTSITAGQSTTLTWSSTNATSCSSYTPDLNGINGSIDVYPTQYTMYALTCDGPGGSIIEFVTVDVSPAPTVATPSLFYFFASPSTISQPGLTSTLYWGVNNATSCLISGTISGGSHGWANVFPTWSSSYSLTCVNGAGGPSATFYTSVTVAGSVDDELLMNNSKQNLASVYAQFEAILKGLQELLNQGIR